MTLREASVWASEHLKKRVTTSNISYLVQYGRVARFGDDGNSMVSRRELERYYQSYVGSRELSWRGKLGDDLDWHLSFDHLREVDTTKHVHRLHPYKGKFIPQLVEYFLDDHTDEFKKEVYFSNGDIVLDPFCGSGTTLVQANELGMHAIGIDVSKFNALISNVKVGTYDLMKLSQTVTDITHRLRGFMSESNIPTFEHWLGQELAQFNNEYFPSPAYKRRVNNGEIDGDTYGSEKARQFLPIFQKLVKEYGIKLSAPDASDFLQKWYFEQIRREIDFVFEEIQAVRDSSVRKALTVMLSRTVRSCRATTHSDLGTLKEPVQTAYYCPKHGKICKPLFSILSWWLRYSADTIQRLATFKRLRTETHQVCLAGDSRKIDLLGILARKDKGLWRDVGSKGIAGIFSSPPYVGMIDYHEQHAYAYQLFGFERKDELEIGALSQGQNRQSRSRYVTDIAAVLRNCGKYTCTDSNIFLVANDKYDLYPSIAEAAGLRIINRFKRPVLNRTERDKGAYSETIFHMKGA
ncbi:MAG: site-specific DNA-methyltransferase [Candidatus Zixiibacteriota bacterium]|nr:MAG: site-specific DNA-methyltransferase [candidate division Zixibacteria bacterium]